MSLPWRPSVGADTDSVLRSPAQGRGGQGRCSRAWDLGLQIPALPLGPTWGIACSLKTRWGEMGRPLGSWVGKGAHPSSTRVALAGFLDTP